MTDKASSPVGNYPGASAVTGAFHVLVCVTEGIASIADFADTQGAARATGTQYDLCARADLLVGPAALGDSRAGALSQRLRWRTTEEESGNPLLAADAASAAAPRQLHLWLPLGRVLRNVLGASALLGTASPASPAQQSAGNLNDVASIHVTVLRRRRRSATKPPSTDQADLRHADRGAHRCPPPDSDDECPPDMPEAVASAWIELTAQDVNAVMAFAATSAGAVPVNASWREPYSMSESQEEAELEHGQLPVALCLTQVAPCLYIGDSEAGLAAIADDKARGVALHVSSIIAFDPAVPLSTPLPTRIDPRERMPHRPQTVAAALQCLHLEEHRHLVVDQCAGEFRACLEAYRDLLVAAEEDYRDRLAVAGASGDQRKALMRSRGTTCPDRMHTFVDAGTQASASTKHDDPQPRLNGVHDALSTPEAVELTRARASAQSPLSPGSAASPLTRNDANASHGAFGTQRIDAATTSIEQARRRAIERLRAAAKRTSALRAKPRDPSLTRKSDGDDSSSASAELLQRRGTSMHASWKKSPALKHRPASPRDSVRIASTASPTATTKTAVVTAPLSLPTPLRPLPATRESSATRASPRTQLNTARSLASPRAASNGPLTARGGDPTQRLSELARERMLSLSSKQYLQRLSNVVSPTARKRTAMPAVARSPSPVQRLPSHQPSTADTTISFRSAFSATGLTPARGTAARSAVRSPASKTRDARSNSTQRRAPQHTSRTDVTSASPAGRRSAPNPPRTVTAIQVNQRRAQSADLS
jgi:hypothetical protein